MNNIELSSIYGGVSFSASFFSALTKALTQIFKMGRKLGSGLIRSWQREYCPL